MFLSFQRTHQSNLNELRREVVVDANERSVVLVRHERKCNLVRERVDVRIDVVLEDSRARVVHEVVTDRLQLAAAS